MNQDQTDSIVRTVLKIAGAWLLQHGLTTQASLVNSPDVCGLIVLLIGFWQSHQSHADSAGSTCAPHVPSLATTDGLPGAIAHIPRSGEGAQGPAAEAAAGAREARALPVEQNLL